MTELDFMIYEAGSNKVWEDLVDLLIVIWYDKKKKVQKRIINFGLVGELGATPFDLSGFHRKRHT